MSRILVFGEILYDLFEEKAEIGGAPFNFAAHLASLGEQAVLVSAVGKDAMGMMAEKELEQRGIDARYVAKTDLPTGYCKVTFENGAPRYNLVTGVAYDHIPVPDLKEEYDALYFGTLSQRSEISKKTLFTLLDRQFNEIFLDVNVRKPFYTRELLEESIGKATVVKISREEAFVLLPYSAPEDYCKALLGRYPNLKQVVLTLDKDGSMVCDRAKGVFHSPKPSSKAISTVGAGDSFGACYLHHYLKGDSIERCLEAATALSDFVVTKLGAVPELPEELKQKII